MTNLNNEHEPQSLSVKMLLGVLAGVYLEYFDYTLYGFSAPYISHAFFPAEKPAVEVLLVWGVFAISFLLRPIGAVIFGHFADKFGRRQILIVNMLLMYFATIMIGFLPTYFHIGILAPAGLILCRMVQGLAVSTEYSGSSTYLLEFYRKRQGLISGIITSASGFGIFSASLLVLFFNSLQTNILSIANWRWSFILAGMIIGILGLYLRIGLQESPKFLQVQKERRVERVPIFAILSKAPRRLLVGILISAYAGIMIIVIEVYLPSYLPMHFNITKEQALAIASFLSLTEACLAIAFGAFSDYFGVTKTIATSGILLILTIFPIMLLFHQDHYIYWYLAALMLAFLVAAVDGPMAAFLTNNFSTETRYTGVSVSYSIGAAVFGGLSPVLLLALEQPLPLASLFSWYLITAAVLMLVILRWLR